MEATSQVLVPSPSSPDNAIVSPESLSHHSSPAKSSRVLHYAQHVTIDETRLPPSLRSSHHQLLQQSRRSTPSTPPPPFQSGPLSPAMSILSNNSFGRVDSSQALVPHSSAYRIDSQETKSPDSNNGAPSTTTQHLAVLYQTNHHLHPILVSPNRRQSRLPDSSRFLHQQSLSFAPAQREIKAWVFVMFSLILIGKLYRLREIVERCCRKKFCLFTTRFCLWKGFSLQLWLYLVLVSDPTHSVAPCQHFTAKY